ncbi:MAG: PorV/PorQ family protein [Bacteroidetes bacterium]|nr:PorV/PorQ family protein [Bacteroidota bacterium]
MRTTLSSFLAVVMALALLSATATAGGGDRTGTAGASQLLIPVGARGIALGSSNSAGISGLNAIYYNPAGLSASRQSAEAMFSHMQSFGDMGVDYAAVGAQFSGFGYLAFSLKSLSFGDIDLTDERNPDGTGATWSPTFVALGLTYSRALTDRIRAGVTAYLVSEDQYRVSASSAVFDIGVQYQGLAGLRGLSIGVTLRHLGGNMQYTGSGLTRRVDELDSKRDPQLLRVEAAGFSMPTSLELSASYAQSFADLHALTFSGAFENNNFLSDQYRLGVEYGFKNFFFLRGSYNVAGTGFDDAFGETAYQYGAAFGAGVNFDAGDMNIGVDYAYRDMVTFDGNHVITVNLGF